MNTGTLFGLSIMALFTAGAFIFVGVMLAKRELVNRVAKFGVDGKAIITEKKWEWRGKVRICIATYKFDAPGADGKNRSFTVEEHVKFGMYQYLTEGMEVTIRYIPIEPAATALLWGAYADDSHETTPILRDVAFLIGIGIFMGIVALGSFSKNDPQQNLFPTPYVTRVTSDLVPTVAVRYRPDGDLVPIMTAVATYRTEWEQVTDQTVHHVTPAQVGLSSSLFTDLVYGTCSDGGFYIFVSKGLNPTRFDAYGYTMKPNEPCRPSDWALSEKNDLGGGWFSVTVVVRDAH